MDPKYIYLTEVDGRKAETREWRAGEQRQEGNVLSAGLKVEADRKKLSYSKYNRVTIVNHNVLFKIPRIILNAL